MLLVKTIDTTSKKITHNKITKKEDIEYSLNIHIFNPSKNSPPSSWQLRLKNRINSLNHIQELIL